MAATTTAAGKKDWQKIFFKALTEIPNIAYGLRKAHVSRVTIFYHCKRSAAFKARMDEALKTGIEGLEEECWKRAHDGVARGVWRNDAEGNPMRVETIKEYSDTLAICLLKAHVPEKYRERSETALTGANGEPLAVLGLKITEEELPKPKEQPDATQAQAGQVQEAGSKIGI